MRALRIAAPVQLVLPVDERHAEPAAIWHGLPEQARAQALMLLARLIRAGSLPSGQVPR
jgi:hypothetical protein